MLGKLPTASGVGTWLRAKRRWGGATLDRAMEDAEQLAAVLAGEFRALGALARSQVLRVAEQGATSVRAELLVLARWGECVTALRARLRFIPAGALSPTLTSSGKPAVQGAERLILAMCGHEGLAAVGALPDVPCAPPFVVTTSRTILPLRGDDILKTGAAMGAHKLHNAALSRRHLSASNSPRRFRLARNAAVSLGFVLGAEGCAAGLARVGAVGQSCITTSLRAIAFLTCAERIAARFTRQQRAILGVHTDLQSLVPRRECFQHCPAPSFLKKYRPKPLTMPSLMKGMV